MKKYLIGSFATLLAAASPLAISTECRAEELNQIFKKVEELAQQKQFPKAMEELAWAKKELEKLHQARLGELLPTEVAGFKGDTPEFQSMMGFTNIERTYKNGDQQIKLTITGSSGSEGLGGLAGLAQMGMMMEGTQNGAEQFRIDGNTASLNKDGTELSLFVKGGSNFVFTAGNGVDRATLKKFGESFKVGELEKYLKGS